VGADRGGGGHRLAPRDPDRAIRERAQRARQVGREQHARDRRHHDAEDQDPTQRHPLLLDVGRQRPPGPGEHHRVAGRRADRRVGEERLLAVGLVDERPAAPLGRRGDRLCPSRAGRHQRATRRIDHLPVSPIFVDVDQHRIGLARQVLVKAGRDQVVLGERDDADQRAREPSPADDRLNDLERLTQRRLVGDAEERPGGATVHGPEPGSVAEGLATKGRAVGDRTQAKAVAVEQQHRRVVENGVRVRAGQDLFFLQQVRVGGVHLGHDRQALELVFQDLEIVAQREGAVLGEQLVLGGQLATHRAGRLIDDRAARQADRNDQQRRKHQRELCPECQGQNASTADRLLHTLCGLETRR
jgi:hypothetical protein